MLHELPDWLYNISYGLAEHRYLRILLEGTRYAVVQIPGGTWFDNSGGHYGQTTFYLVDKQATNYRKGIGLLDAKELQHGGRAKLAQWKKLIQEQEK
jgi:hypothetical protein